MSVRQFAAYRSPGKGRVFALLDDPADTLEVVTTLGADDLALTDSLVAELNAYLAEREDKALDEVLRQLPEAVRRAVTSFLRQHCEPEPGTYGVHGAIRRLRLVYFDDRTPDFEEYVDAALHDRTRRPRDERGRPGW
nr:hypothetical protein GCM10020241_04470 [Streptoalloteichus tenebrarius]